LTIDKAFISVDASHQSHVVLRVYIMGRAAIPIYEEVLSNLMTGLEGFRVRRLDREVAAMKRDLASLRREVEASRPNKVVAMNVAPGLTQRVGMLDILFG
jgi:hypothetical protein